MRRQPHIDGDGDLDAFVGEGYGRTAFFENVALGCPHTPALGCTTGFANGSLQVNEKTAGKEKVLASLLNGPALAQTELGNPLASGGTSYDLCLYDDQRALVGQIDVDRAGETCAGKACWTPIGDPPPAGKGYLVPFLAVTAGAC